ncbi:putative NADP(+)-dependent dehydrogenase [Leptodontidium sp. MPI-SDFR-AT-0119]|nr:putative NADP(+)-dependent dehydrogenase [Leptodontidium sp. MPI-SDFR-AT-0119]
MPSPFETVLLIGATSGIGEELARHYHAVGKKVIIAGRRLERLNRLKSELPGLEAIQMDIQDVDAIPGVISHIFSEFPSIDGAIILAGQQNYFNFNSAKLPLVAGKGNPNTLDITSEISTNLTGPIILTREIGKHALSESRAARPFTLAFTTSGLGFIPAPIFPVYCASKAALNSFIVSMRAQLADTHINLVEIIPPYVKTDLDSHHLDVVHAAWGENAQPGQDVVTYVRGLVEGMEKLADDGKPPRIVAEGFPLLIATTWADAFRSIALNFGLKL